MYVLITPLDEPVAIRFCPANGVYGISLRIFQLIPFLALIGTLLYFMLPQRVESWLSVTDFVTNFFYLFLLVATSLVFIVYFIRGESTTTVIPCLTSTWYKAYTGSIILIIVVMIIIAAIETRKTQCGDYTSYPPRLLGAFWV